MKLIENLDNLQKKLSEIQQDIQELKQQAQLLAWHNQQLSENLAQGADRGLESLQKIYIEGFHVCSTQFSLPREGGDCLFCLQLLTVQLASHLNDQRSHGGK